MAEVAFNLRRLAPLCLGAALLSGCAAAPEPALEHKIAAPLPAPAPPRDAALELLEYAHGLATASPSAREAAVAEAHERARARGSAMAYARLALAFARPGQRRYTPDEAARYARRALDAEDADWSPAAAQYLADIARLYGALTAERQTGLAGEAAAEPETVPRNDDRARIRDLEVALDEARRKLRELADIETRLDEGAEPGAEP